MWCTEGDIAHPADRSGLIHLAHLSPVFLRISDHE